MNMHTKKSESTIAANGQTSVPVAIRKRFDCTPGTRLDWHVQPDGRLMVRVKTVAEMK